MSFVHLETLVGKKVRDADGKVAGRLEEVHADWRGGECIVTYYQIARKGTYFVRKLGMSKKAASLIVTWDKMDLSDPKGPRLKFSMIV